MRLARASSRSCCTAFLKKCTQSDEKLQRSLLYLLKRELSPRAPAFLAFSRAGFIPTMDRRSTLLRIDPRPPGKSPGRRIPPPLIPGGPAGPASMFISPAKRPRRPAPGKLFAGANACCSAHPRLNRREGAARRRRLSPGHGEPCSNGPKSSRWLL